MNTTLKRICAASAACLGLVGTSAVSAAPLAANLLVPTIGIDSTAEVGDAANTRLSFQLQPGGDINALFWDLSLTAFGSSWLSDLAVSLTNSDGIGVTLTPSDVDAAGTGSFSGSVWLPDLGNAFSLGADGMLHLEFHEVLDDFAGADGRWNTGSLVVSSVPEPGTFGLMAVALAGAAAASRRRSR